MTQTDNTGTSTQPGAEQTGEELPPYSGDDTACRKCGYEGAITRYRQAGEYRPGELAHRRPSTRGERLERECVRCDYVWDEALNPAPGTQAATVTELAYALRQAHHRWAVDLSQDQAEQVATELLAMCHIQIRPDHPSWAQAGIPAPRRLLVAPADMQQTTDPPLVAQTPIAMVAESHPEQDPAGPEHHKQP